MMEPNSAILEYTAARPVQTMIVFQNKPAVPPLSKLRDSELRINKHQYIPGEW
jgi:hypothetical protein